MRRVIVQLALVSLVAGSSARAQALSHDLATRVIQGCVDHAKQKRQGHAIAVFDAGAQPLAFLRMDGNASGIGAFAMEKAAAVAHWRFATSEMANAATATAGLRACAARRHRSRRSSHLGSGRPDLHRRGRGVRRGPG